MAKPHYMGRRVLCLLGVVLLGMAAADPARASGTYRPKTAPPARGSVDAQRYLSGKEIFTGKQVLPTPSPSTEPDQRGRLQALAQRLPKQAKPEPPLESLAGRLTEEQLDALQYYLAIRFKLKATGVCCS